MTDPAKAVVVQRLGDLLVVSLAGLLSITGLLLTLSGRSWGLLCVVLALAVVTGKLGRSRSEASESWSPLGRRLALRALPIAAAATALVRPGSSRAEAVAAALGAAVLLGCLACEPAVSRATRMTVPVATRLPGLPAPPSSPAGLDSVTVATSLLATAAGLLLAALDLSPWWWLVLTLVPAVPLGILALAGRAKIVFARRLRSMIPEAVADYAPDFVVYTSRPDDASYQILMWLPYLQRSGLRFLVVTRNAVPAAALARQCDVPVVEARGMADLEGLVVPSLKAAFYVNASSGNGAFVRFQHLTHIYLGHGDSDKPPSYNPTHAMYDQIFTAGPAATRRYAAHGVRIPADKFRIVGRPQVEGVQPVTRAIGAVAEPVVLYAPTWRGHVEETLLYSLPTGERIVSALLARGATVVFRPHPFSYDFPDDAASIRRIHALLAEDTRRTGRAHLWGAAAESERSVLDCINVSDAMVSDVSSVVSDYLFSGKPFAMIAVPSAPEDFVSEFPVAAASYVVRGDLADLDTQLDQMLGADPLVERRRALRDDYLGDFPAEHYADAFVHQVQQVARQPRSDQGSEDGVGADRSTADEADRPGTIEEEGSELTTAAGGGLSRYRQLLVRMGLELGSAALALGSLAAALLGAPLLVAALLAVAAVATVLRAAPRVVRRPLENGVLARGEVTRATLLAALAVVTARQDLLSWATGCGLTILTVALVAEGPVRAAWGRFGLTAVNLPGSPPPVNQLIPRAWLPLASLAVLLGGFVLAGLAGEGGPLPAGTATAVFLGLCLGVAAFLLLTVERALRRAGEVTRGELGLRAALEDLQPEFAVYFASTVGAGYQVGMWLPYFLRIGRPFVVLTRSVPMLREIARLCDEQGLAVPVVYRPTLRSLEDVVVPTMTSAFYVNNAVRNTHFIERRELTHVWLNHGDSEKPACYNPVHAIYDVIFAAGQAAIDRYARHGVEIPREKFQIVGRPQVEQIEPARGPVQDQNPPTVLYAPTWQGPYADTRVFSLPLGRAIVAGLLERGVRVVFRAHPFNYRYGECRTMITEIGAMLDAHRAGGGPDHLWGSAAETERSVEDCFNLSDAMISDVSAVVSDYLRSDKPFAMVSVGRTPDQLMEEAPAARAAYVLREDLSNLAQVLDDLLGPDPLAATRVQTRVYYLGDFPHGHYADGFLDAARRVIDAGHAVPHVAAVPEPA